MNEASPDPQVPGTDTDQRQARIWEAMARILCELGGADPDFRMWDGQPLWKWRMHGVDARAQIQAAIDALQVKGDAVPREPGSAHRWI